MQHLKPETFATWAEYYWQYQYSLASEWFLPWLQEQGFLVKGRHVLDVGCGIGGFLAAFADAGASRCLGLEIRPFPWPEHPGVEYRVQNIHKSANENAVTSDAYDLIILRDVIEHIPLSQKSSFVQALRQFAHPHTRYLVAFPPWRSPFGLHQQVHASTLARNVPFLSWLPWKTLRPMLALAGETEKALEEMEEVVDSRMTLKGFEELCEMEGWQVLGHVFHSIRPSHQLRYGWKTRKFRGGWLPGLREVAVMGAAYYLADRPLHQRR